MKVSIIIPVYNEQRDIEACLSSLLAQNYSDLEIIVVDDGSTDKTIKLAKKYPVKLFKQSHLGAGPARNLGASHATGQILVFVDADMTFSSSFIKNLIAPIVQKKAIGTFSQDEMVANPENVWSTCWSVNQHLPPTRRLPLNGSPTQPVFRAILKSSFLTVGGFDPVGYTDDWTLSAKLGRLAVAAPHSVFYHRNPDNLTEVWKQAAWIGKRPYKLGVIGQLITLLRSSLPVSLLIGSTKAVSNSLPQFIIFKVTYDTAIFWSVFASFFTGFKYK